MRHFKSVMSVGLLAGLVWAGAIGVRSQEQAGKEWRYYGADHAFTRYSPLDQITRDNVKNVTIAWRRPAVNSALTDAYPDLKVNAYLKSNADRARRRHLHAGRARPRHGLQRRDRQDRVGAGSAEVRKPKETPRAAWTPGDPAPICASSRSAASTCMR